MQSDSRFNDSMSKKEEKLRSNAYSCVMSYAVYFVVYAVYAHACTYIVLATYVHFLSHNF